MSLYDYEIVMETTNLYDKYVIKYKSSYEKCWNQINRHF